MYVPWLAETAAEQLSVTWLVGGNRQHLLSVGVNSWAFSIMAEAAEKQAAKSFVCSVMKYLKKSMNISTLYVRRCSLATWRGVLHALPRTGMAAQKNHCSVVYLLK